MARKADRRVQRTRQLLRVALFSLIQERGFEALSVQDIIDRANVGRATFYAHFDNKEDLLVSGFESLRASLREGQREARLRGNVEERVFAFSQEMLMHAGEHRELFQAMAGKRSGAMVESIMHKLLVDLVRDDVKEMLPRGDAHTQEALVQFIAGGLFGMLMWWLRGKMRASVEDLNAVFRQLAIPAVKAAVPGAAVRRDDPGRSGR